MKKIFTALAFFLLINNLINAQKLTPGQLDQPFGTIDIADLKMTECDFEKGANAMVLFDKAVVVYKNGGIIMERHKRIKIFNDNGKNEANVRIEFYGAHRDEIISDIEAETINLNNASIECTNVDKKLIYTEATDKNRKAIIFTFPDVKAGSVVEFKYKWKTSYPYNYPSWAFQTTTPTRYSEFNASFSSEFSLEFFRRVYQPMFKDTVVKLNSNNDRKHIWALSNIKSYKTEPYMDYPEDYLQRIMIKIFHIGRSWFKIAADMLNDEDFGEQLKKNLGKSDEIIAKAKTLRTNDEKISYIFNTVKNSMKWDKTDYWFTVEGVKKAWDKKTGNSTEINMVLYNLLKSADVNTSLLVLCTRDNGKTDLSYPSSFDLDRTVIYYPVDSAKYYVLDASNPYNTYNNIPFDLIGLKVLFIDPDSKKFKLFPLKNGETAEVTLVNGSIGTDGKLEGTAQISGSTYSREKYLKQYNDLGEKKYIDKVQDKYKSLKITSFRLDNAKNDTLPLIQTFEFKYNLTESDGDYMYFDPALFTGFERTNPFLREDRVSNIDFGCLYSYSINGHYKVPAGYKVDVLPKSAMMQMPDKGIVFKRFTAEQDGAIVIHYTVNFKRSVFSKDEYPGIRDFYKKMYEMLNEQIVLKKQ